MSYSSQYYWVVLCKNRRFHRQQNLFFGHSIPLGETDAILPPPTIDGKIKVRCDNCGEEYSYKAKEVLRAELEITDSFVPHPMFDVLKS